MDFTLHPFPVNRMNDFLEQQRRFTPQGIRPIPGDTLNGRRNVTDLAVRTYPQIPIMGEVGHGSIPFHALKLLLFSQAARLQLANAFPRLGQFTLKLPHVFRIIPFNVRQWLPFEKRISDYCENRRKQRL